MTFRKFLAIIIALAISVCFCACNTETTVINTNANTDADSNFKGLFSDIGDTLLNQLEEERENQTKFGTFVVLSCINLGNGLEQYILYDSYTMVMYSYIDGYQSGGLTEMYNADGTLRLYSPEEVNETE